MQGAAKRRGEVRASWRGGEVRGKAVEEGDKEKEKWGEEKEAREKGEDKKGIRIKAYNIPNVFSER